MEYVLYIHTRQLDPCSLAVLALQLVLYYLLAGPQRSAICSTTGHHGPMGAGFASRERLAS